VVAKTSSETSSGLSRKDQLLATLLFVKNNSLCGMYSGRKFSTFRRKRPFPLLELHEIVRFLRNVGRFLPDYTEEHFSIQRSS
jgi:hypothetical protein